MVSIHWQGVAPFPWYLHAKGPIPPLEARALHKLRVIVRQPPTSVTWINSWIDCQTSVYTIWLSIQQFNQLPNQQWDPLFGQLSDPYSNRVHCYYVSWKTTSYYRKDSLKLAVRCPVSGCWPSCYFRYVHGHETSLGGWMWHWCHATFVLNHTESVVSWYRPISAVYNTSQTVMFTENLYKFSWNDYSELRHHYYSIKRPTFQYSTLLLHGHISAVDCSLSSFTTGVPCGLRGVMCPWFICWFWCCIDCFLVYLASATSFFFTYFSLLIYFLTYLFLWK